MLTFDVKRKINTLRDILVGKVPDPKAQVEQITIALIYKFMDDMDIEGLEFGGTRQFFTGEYEKYAWTEIMKPENSGQQRAFLYAEGIEKMATNPNLPQLFRDIFRGAYIPYRDPDTLNMFLKEVSDFSYDNSEDLGNAFEYLLSIMGSQGDAGQFRTPRHIIDMMVELVQPTPDDFICDPACGTAGFLVSSAQYLRAHYEDSMTPEQWQHFAGPMFTGFDTDRTMLRISAMNLMLHSITNPEIDYKDSVSKQNSICSKYTICLANPPFKGTVDAESINDDLKAVTNTKKTELLFLALFLRMLKTGGRCACIVPDGVLFGSSKAHQSIRKELIENHQLRAVISMPSGVFKPYAGVSTAVLVFTKTGAGGTDRVWFYDMKADGFSLDDKRTEVKENDIPDIIARFHNLNAETDRKRTEQSFFVPKEEIAANGYDLSINKYKETEYVPVEYPSTTEILADLHELEMEITKGLAELEEMV